MSVRKPYRQFLGFLAFVVAAGLLLLLVDMLRPRPVLPPEAAVTTNGKPQEAAEPPGGGSDAVLYFATPAASAGGLEILREEHRRVRLGTLPEERAKSLVRELAAGSREGNLETVPRGASLLQFYLLEGGAAIANFDRSLVTGCPPGVEAELALVYSIANTLTRNIPEVRSVRILVNGSELETAAGHLDLSGELRAEKSLVGGSTPRPDAGSSPPGTR